MTHHRVDAVTGLAGWACHGHGGWCGPVLSPEYTRMKKKPCKRQFTGLGVIDTSSCLIWTTCRRFVAPVESSGEVLRD